ncbi:hypothetical protein [Microbacterium sp. BK668]|uniref:hypothetical protein n=1 Tax=Microbacterium sp. BK668 TaxID=2512118 RepID=UPI0010DB00C0|nr:hypothetical protein [Microbacterium sp. BK668]TDN91837.1 hypothetical protein EV279_1342 [Microbacterium sp. BK668]
MKRIWPFLVPGVILAAVGLIWTLQGTGVIQGSAMSGSSLWATIGPVVLLAGIALVVVAVVVAARGRRAR